MSARFTNQRGFTLVETLIGVVCMVALMTSLMTMLERTMSTEPKITNRSKRVNDARVLAERITRELRQAYGFEAAASDSVDFYTYTRSGGAATATTERVAYRCTSSTGICERSHGTGTPPDPAGAWEQVMDGVTNSDVFEFVPDTINPEYVRVKLVFSVADQSHTITVTDGANLRNATNFDD